MSYDITFCEGTGCKRRNKCHRYTMYQVYKADKREDKPRFIMMYKGESKNCLMFWEDENTTLATKSKVVRND